MSKTFKLGQEVKGKRDPMELAVTTLSRNVLNNQRERQRRIELQVRLAF